MRQLSRRPMIAAAAAAALLAACGGGKSGLSHSELAAKGNAVCADVNKGFEELFSSPEARDENQTPEAVQQLMKRMLAVYDSAGPRFHALDPNKADSRAYQAFLTGLDKWTADLRAASTDPAKAKTLFEGEGPVAVNQLAAKAGVDGCEPKE